MTFSATPGTPLLPFPSLPAPGSPIRPSAPASWSNRTAILSRSASPTAPSASSAPPIASGTTSSFNDPQSRIPTTPHHPPSPNPPECFPLSVLSPTPSHPKKSRKPLKASKFEPSPRPYPILRLSSQACEISIPFLYRPDFSKSSLFLPSLVRTSSFCLLTQSRYGVPFPSLRPHRRRTAAVPHGSSFFRSPHPPDRRRTVNGPFLRPRFPSALCLLQLSAGCRPFRPPFCAQNAPASPTAPCSRPKPPIPFSPQLFLFSPAKLRKT